MDDLSTDFDVLAERAEDNGAYWALRVLYRSVRGGDVPLPVWPGTMDEAKHLVDSFAARVGVADREELATILQASAAMTWNDCLAKLGANVPTREELVSPRAPASSLFWHLAAN
jgi:hypothetical protein